MKPLVSYIRVSTSQQGRSGLGIEAQREGLARFADAECFEIVAEFVEVETGKGSDALDCESAPNFDPQPFHCKHLKDKRIENSPFPNEGLDLEEKALDEKGPADLEIVPVAATCRSSVKPFR